MLDVLVALYGSTGTRVCRIGVVGKLASAGHHHRTLAVQWGIHGV